MIPFALACFLSLLLALVINAAALLPAALASGLVPGPIDGLIVQLGLVGMLVSISAAISARTFPLYLRLRVPPRHELTGLFVVYLSGFVLRASSAFDLPPALAVLPALGALLLGLAFLGLVVVLDVPLRRTTRTPAGQEGPPVAANTASAWLIVAAYTWLGVAGLLLVLDGLAGFGLVEHPPLDAERHALGAGLVTLLVLGMAVRLVPGFSGRKLYSARLVWATVGWATRRRSCGLDRCSCRRQA